MLITLRKNTKNKVKFIALSLLVLGIAFLVFFIDNKMQKRNQAWTVLTSSDSAPFSFYQDNELTGFDIDLIKMIACKLGTTIVLQDLPFYSLIKHLSAFYGRSCDMAITSISETKERKKKFDMSIPYYTSHSVLLVAKDSKISSEKDLADQTIVVRSGSIQESIAKLDWIPLIGDIKIVSYSKLALKDIVELIKGKFAAIVLDREEAVQCTTLTPYVKIIPLENTENKMCIALPKGSFLTRKINAAIEELKKEGCIRELEKKWFVQDLKP